MEIRPDGSLLVQTPLSMSRLSREDLPGEGADIARLVQRTLGGDRAAFEQIIQRYETRVMTLALRLVGVRDEARDVTQEVFLRAFKYLHRLDVQKPVEPWLMRITVNVCRDAVRTRRRRHETFVNEERPDVVDQSPDPYAGMARTQERLLLQKALDSLPEKERLAVLLRDVEGLSTSEVASVLGSSETTVRSQVSRGRLRLKAEIDRLTERGVRLQPDLPGGEP